MKLEVVNMYPDILNIYGDIGNLICIKNRCEWRGIDINIKNFTIDKETNLEDSDMILIGGGSDKGQDIISDHILNQRNSLESFIEAKKPILAICGSYQIFGNYYLNPYNEKIPCLEIFEMETISKKERLTGDILISNNLRSDSLFKSKQSYNLTDIIGFENHGGRTYHNYDPLGNVKVGFGNNGEDGEEGMIYKNFIGSYLHGPILPKNPHIADYMIFNALKNKYDIDYLNENILNLKDIDDSIEINAHNIMKNRILKT
ncbi:MAG: glutamine amidotransferase [Methanobrevibacter arboriphilus]|uniref:Lipid II isoglutaminyl synthase (glutamine-hydrolyzing) subunit GatD n=1 Tax=Methanobrevibacter arboriphilus TaxID=39441 RepID=A0A843AQD7_METAZ|nr:glutamine amidotransferase [Methanobrevibacter arboriphilus]MBF4468970.1 glutamine amidotransferase [Methanobrevibacter arboriphilus]